MAERAGVIELGQPEAELDVEHDDDDVQWDNGDQTEASEESGSDSSGRSDVSAYKVSVEDFFDAATGQPLHAMWSEWQTLIPWASITLGELGTRLKALMLGSPEVMGRLAGLLF